MRRFFSSLVVAFLVAGPGSACLAADVQVAGTPPTSDTSVALSPDGQTLAVMGRHEGRKHIWLKPAGSGAARPLPGTVDASFPFWSPDGRKLGFFASDEMRQIDIETGKVTTILPRVTYASGASWGKDGIILFSTAGQYIIWRVPETGGQPTPAATLDGPDQFSLSRPHFLPDGINFLFHAQGRAGERGIYQGIIDAPQIKRRLVDSESAAVFADGKLYYTHNGELHARSFDPVLGIVENDDQVIVRNVATGSPASMPVSSNGKTVAYRTASATSGKQLVWYDRAGKPQGTVGAPFGAGGGSVSLSPDGKSAVINYVEGGVTNIGVIDLASGRITPVSDGPENDLDQLWASDGASVLFASKRTMTIETYEQELGKPLKPEKVFETMDLRRPMDMTRDGRYLFYRKNMPDLWVLDRQTGKETNLVPMGTSVVHWPKVSPDGKWIVVQAQGGGAHQIQVYGPFAPPAMGTMSKPLTTNGGGWPRWRGDGKELFYVEADGSLMSISLSYSADGSSFTASQPVKLFSSPINSSYVNTGAGPQFAVTPDGQRFLVLTSPEFEIPVYLHGN